MDQEDLERQLRSEETVCIVPSLSLSTTRHEYLIFYYTQGYFYSTYIRIRNKRIRISRYHLAPDPYFRFQDLGFIMSAYDFICLARVGDYVHNKEKVWLSKKG